MVDVKGKSEIERFGNGPIPGVYGAGFGDYNRPE